MPDRDVLRWQCPHCRMWLVFTTAGLILAAKRIHQGECRA